MTIRLRLIPRQRAGAVREYLATLDDAAFGAASDVTPKFVSPSDPAAQWTGAMRGPAFFAYANNYLIDVKFGVTGRARSFDSRPTPSIGGLVQREWLCSGCGVYRGWRICW
jgi:hypothetical protein